MDTPKKRVMFVITKGNWGGAQRYVYDLAMALPSDRYEVSVAFGVPGLLATRLTEAGIRTHIIHSLARDLSLTGDARSFAELVRTFRNERPDVVHLNSSKAGGVGALAARIAGVPRIVFTAHGWPFSEQRGLAWRTFALLGSWATALLSHTVIVVSGKDLELGRKLPFCASKMHLVYNGIAPQGLSDGSVIRQAFPAGVHITGTIGELTANKNQISLVEAARANPDLYIAIVGEGEERAHLETAIHTAHLEDRVKLFGFLPAREALRGFDTFTLPSLKEGLPYVLLEAKAAGLPITANRVGGVGEILDAPDMSRFTFEHMLSETLAVYER